MINRCPLTIHLPLPKFAEIRNFVKLRDECWKQIKEMQRESEKDRLTQVLLDSLTGEASTKNRDSNKCKFEEIHAKNSSLVMILAGVAPEPETHSR